MNLWFDFSFLGDRIQVDQELCPPERSAAREGSERCPAFSCEKILQVVHNLAPIV